MVAIEKLIKKFLDNPTSLNYAEIEKIMLTSNFIAKWGRGSHRKIINTKTNKSYTVPIHNNDCLAVYKANLRKIYINNKLLGIK